MALMNIVSSNINQWTILAAMIPIVYGFDCGITGCGRVPFDIAQRNELALTLLQTMLGVLLLANMEFGLDGCHGAVRTLGRPVHGAPAARPDHDRVRVWAVVL